MHFITCLRYPGSTLPLSLAMEPNQGLGVEYISDLANASSKQVKGQETRVLNYNFTLMKQ
jgi:hypothetical protein